MTPRIAITGVGLVTALGATREHSWRRMLAGDCGIRPTTLFDTDGYRSRVAGEVDIDAVDDGATPLQRRRRSRSDRIGVRAASEALDDSGLLDAAVDRSRIGVFLGAGTADLLRNEEFFRTWITRGLSRTRRSDLWNHFPSTPVDVIAGQFGFEGPRACVAAACASSTIAIGRAVEAIRAGRADAAIAGGTDALARLTYSGFNLLRLMDASPCRPFDRSRAGMNIGEGAGMLVLEDFERACARGATIYAELAGHSLACEAFHPTAPEPEGRPIAAVVALALEDARIDPDEVDHINAHGTATPQNDAAESRGFRRVFGDRAARIPVTSIKSMIGHCLGAAGAVEAAALALTVARGAIPPTINHAETDADCAVDIVANQAREQRVTCAVSTSLGFGGNDSAIVMRRVN
ncbi:MAG TPA: beta-ketoacyl-[acyl-carrier-protein] synthase family protein [Vicinamibacterales bacterium]|nr:beta-ketoacyl-[acyl-carrier-protein] synthase family protein [Vicinamibacterales bacterium]